MSELDFTFDETKATQAVGVLVSEAGGLFDYYLMMKCLYAVEREAIIEWGQPVIGGELKMLPWGPINQAAMDALKPNRQGWFAECFERIGNEIRLKRDPGTSELSDAEIDLIKKACAEWKGLSFQEAHDKSLSFPECPRHQAVSWISPEEILIASGKSAEDIELTKSSLKEHRLIFPS